MRSNPHSSCTTTLLFAVLGFFFGCGDSGVNPSPPATPTGVHAEAVSADQIVVSWTAVSGAESYVLYRNNAVICTVSTFSYTDTGLTSNTSYAFCVAALGVHGVSGQSLPVSATTRMVCPNGNGCNQLSIVYPNGGEVLRVGDTCKIKIHADTTMELVIRLFVQGGLVDLSVGQTRDMRVPRDSIFNFVIPDSSNSSTMTMFSTASDSCLIHAYWYNNSWCYDESDCYFSIRP